MGRLSPDVPDIHEVDSKSKKIIKGMLRELNIPDYRLGFKYAQDLIVLAYYEKKLSKPEYMAVAFKNLTSSARVMKAISRTIDYCWSENNCPKEILGKYFPEKLQDKPTNEEFIMTLAKAYGTVIRT